MLCRSASSWQRYYFLKNCLFICCAIAVTLPCDCHSCFRAMSQLRLRKNSSVLLWFVRDPNCLTNGGDDGSSWGDHECLCRNSCQSIQQRVQGEPKCWTDWRCHVWTAMTRLNAPNMCWSDKCKWEVAGRSFLNQVSLEMCHHSFFML